ncbi:MAG: hypothetical protein J7M21_02670, partial [Planctomycetes bacterium]|nr:hypothetical protein [Planctomycetota bacterium]
MKRLLVTMVAAAAVTAAAAGGPLKIEQVAGNATWVAHLDAAALLNSGIGKFLLEQAEKKPQFLDGIAKVRQTLGFDPLNDIRSITLYGTRIGDKSGVVIIDGAVDRQKIVSLLEQNPTHSTTTYGDYTLHQWTDRIRSRPGAAGEEDADRPAETKYGTFYDAQTIIVASSMDLLKHAIDVLDGKAESLAKTDGIEILPKPVPGV